MQLGQLITLFKHCNSQQQLHVLSERLQRSLLDGGFVRFTAAGCWATVMQGLMSISCRIEHAPSDHYKFVVAVQVVHHDSDPHPTVSIYGEYTKHAASGPIGATTITCDKSLPESLDAIANQLRRWHAEEIARTGVPMAIAEATAVKAWET